ncbi:MAG: cytochrome c biogenesis protein [Planctomycetota bacterium]|nr:cytochrome c biogenesis protein [Planctomycetota bacterium]
MIVPAPPNSGQILLLAAAILLFIAGNIASLARIRRDRNALRIAAKSLDYFAICLVLLSLAWHAASRGGWFPIEDNFEAIASIGVMLAVFNMYIQRRRPIPGLDWFLMPIVVLLLISAAIFGKAKPDTYRTDSLWSWTHRLSSYGGALAFAIAAAVGTMYLIVSARLRDKRASAGPALGSLERLEHVTQSAAILGFAMLTLGMVTGLIIIIHDGSHTMLGPHWMQSPKVILAFSVWIVYAFALHTPMNPAIRGRKSAMLSILGFVLMFGTIIAVQFMPRGR